MITPQEAADLYRAFLTDSLHQYTSLCVSVRLYMSDDAPPYVPIYGATLHQQHGKGLGERMRNAFHETQAAGYKQIVIIGTDHPTLPTKFIQDAYDSLANPPSLCIGPTDDGGYYLLGMNPMIRGLFDGIVFSQPNVYRHTLDRAHQMEANVVQLPKWYDIDTPDDLVRMAVFEDLIPRNTKKILNQLQTKYAF